MFGPGRKCSSALALALCPGNSGRAPAGSFATIFAVFSAAPSGVACACINAN